MRVLRRLKPCDGQISEGDPSLYAGDGAMTEDDPSTPQTPNSAHSRIPRRVCLSEQQLEALTHEELLPKWHEQDAYINLLELQARNHEAEIVGLRETEERMRQQQVEATQREKVLVRRLATKEQQMQEFANQIAELKAAQVPGAAALRSALLDPAVNLLLQRLRKELQATRARLEETQNELSAWKFTPDSNTGKRLMAKCRLLYQENEELGRMISSGRLAKLEGELALQKNFSEEVKKSQSELDEFLQDLDEDVEGMQSTIYFLQQELRKSKETITNLEQENKSLQHVVQKNSPSVDQNVEVDEKICSIEQAESEAEVPKESQVYEEDSRDWNDSEKSRTREPTPVEKPEEQKSDYGDMTKDVEEGTIEKTEQDEEMKEESAEKQETEAEEENNEVEETKEQEDVQEEEEDDLENLALNIEEKEMLELEGKADDDDNVEKVVHEAEENAESENQDSAAPAEESRTSPTEEEKPSGVESRKRSLSESEDDSDDTPLIKKIRPNYEKPSTPSMTTRRQKANASNKKESSEESEEEERPRITTRRHTRQTAENSGASE